MLTGVLLPFQHIHQRIGLIMTVEGGDRQQIAMAARLHLHIVSEIWQHCLRTAQIPQVRLHLDLLLRGNSICRLSRYSNINIHISEDHGKYDAGFYCSLQSPLACLSLVEGGKNHTMGDTDSTV
jgi:hypothetical protein